MQSGVAKEFLGSISFVNDPPLSLYRSRYRARSPRRSLQIWANLSDVVVEWRKWQQVMQRARKFREKLISQESGGGGKSKRTNPASVAAASTAFICIPINRRIEGEEQGGDTMLSPHNHESNRGSWSRTQRRYMLIMKSVGG